MKILLGKLLTGSDKLATDILQPIVNFGVRFYIAYIFFKSGLTKVDSNFMVPQATIDLFDWEYNAPINEFFGFQIPAALSANLASYAELIFPILLVIGFLSRPAAVGLFILNAVAMIYVASTDFAAVGIWQHTAWGAMLGLVIIYGPSKFSLDSWISDKFKGMETNLILKLVAIAVLSGIGYFLCTS